MSIQPFDLSQNYEIDLITAELLDQETDDDPLFQIMPPTFRDTSRVVWDQPENGFGLLSLRGLNGDPRVTTVTGFRQYSMMPGYYGEKVIINEQQLTLSREPGKPADAIDRQTLISRYLMQVTARAGNRMRHIISTLLRSGRYTIASESGAIVHADQIDGFQLFTPAIGWASSPTTAKVLDDLRAWKEILERGTSTEFGVNSMLLCSDQTFNEIFATADFRSVFRIQYGNTPLGVEGVNHILQGCGLPKIVIYNKGYYATEADAVNRSKTNFVRFLPPRTLIWAGVRPEGVPIGNFVLTKNLSHEGVVGGAPDYSFSNRYQASEFGKGLYTYLQYFQVPPTRIELDVGFNGGPALRYPSAVAGITYS